MYEQEEEIAIACRHIDKINEDIDRGLSSIESLDSLLDIYEQNVITVGTEDLMGFTLEDICKSLDPSGNNLSTEAGDTTTTNKEKVKKAAILVYKAVQNALVALFKKLVVGFNKLRKMSAHYRKMAKVLRQDIRNINSLPEPSGNKVTTSSVLRIFRDADVQGQYTDMDKVVRKSVALFGEVVSVDLNPFKPDKALTILKKIPTEIPHLKTETSGTKSVHKTKLICGKVLSMKSDPTNSTITSNTLSSIALTSTPTGNKSLKVLSRSSMIALLTDVINSESTKLDRQIDNAQKKLPKIIKAVKRLSKGKDKNSAETVMRKAFLSTIKGASSVLGFGMVHWHAQATKGAVYYVTSSLKEYPDISILNELKGKMKTDAPKDDEVDSGNSDQ